MKTSKVIKNLQEMVEVYGDLDFSVSIDIANDLIQHISEDYKIISFIEPITFGFDQREQADGGSEINVRNFPY